ncbi:hypothetical protein F53441_9323 [Fusarium austroafricanum]|uniref:Uncharacterized protein n=1 Tax=Fusarium austroafricanum TaxID=2364996 RepID=A0A8H4P3J6_9HYPO|nr:hypothetical protein F53441_9323 [Fusarium austroafricanum]
MDLDAQTLVNEYVAIGEHAGIPDVHVCIVCIRKTRERAEFYCEECLELSSGWNSCNLCLRSLPSVGSKGFCHRCVPTSVLDTDCIQAKNDAIFVLASFYRPMPSCADCGKFLDGGFWCKDCDERGSDLDDEEADELNTLQGEEAIMSGLYPWPTTHGGA